MSKKKTDVSEHETYPIYIKYVYANESDNLKNVTYVRVLEDDSFIEIGYEKTAGDISYSIDTGTFTYPDNEINRILGRVEYESTKEEFELISLVYYVYNIYQNYLK